VGQQARWARRHGDASPRSARDARSPTRARLPIRARKPAAHNVSGLFAHLVRDSALARPPAAIFDPLCARPPFPWRNRRTNRGIAIILHFQRAMSRDTTQRSCHDHGNRHANHQLAMRHLQVHRLSPLGRAQSHPRAIWDTQKKPLTSPLRLPTDYLTLWDTPPRTDQTLVKSAERIEGKEKHA
jgi:hypothetical protein